VATKLKIRALAVQSTSNSLVLFVSILQLKSFNYIQILPKAMVVG